MARADLGLLKAEEGDQGGDPRISWEMMSAWWHGNL